MNFSSDEPQGRILKWILLAVIAIVVAGALYFLLVVRPAPPESITMATGPEGSAYRVFGERYRAALARHGVELRLVPTEGGVENLQKLNDPASGVSVALAQGGLTTEGESPGLASLGTVFYEPVWIFANGQLVGARDLVGKRISMGRAGSGSRKLGMDLGRAVGLEVAEKDLVDLPQDEVPAALLDGRLDVAVIVAPWESPHLRELLADARVNALSFPRADAHVALRPYLSKVVVPQGVADLRTNRPPQDLVLVAPKTSLIVRKDLHPALQYLLLEAATQVHAGPGIFQKAGQFPSAEPIDVPLTEEARQFYRTGPPFLQRYMPFWMAVFVGRLLVILIPVVGVLLPLLRLLPVVYGWYVRRRIFRLYGELKFLEAELDASAAGFDAQSRLERLDRLEARANKLRVSTMFSQFLYTLRAHIELVRGRLEKRLRANRKDDNP
jgi:TRAP-type uncharacterized transport system substrate-binding protein